ncbi:heterodisulfide reductase [candidate division TA06 bacterium B3_TA06]|uniref:Heterodisulfide reductase n=1 Tax=candidate division TA06 bacterium B3_TA06 TaxID=2012487 RepID=A0A532V010_UNCT6|nr:MAG: heterodisulfide reductase [candidate division TA06 bacterium B3_TA06]
MNENQDAEAVEEVTKAQEPKVIKFDELDPNFKYEIQAEPSGEFITRCYACGTCTASCPVRSIEETFNPRRIIHMALLGMKKEVLSSEFVWLCSTCYACFERCPQDVRITEMMNALKNLAVKNGYIHPAFTAQIDLIQGHGRLYEADSFVNKKRAKIRLPELTESPDPIKAIFKATGLYEYSTEAKESKELPQSGNTEGGSNE